jgi:hypothetical protein
MGQQIYSQQFIDKVGQTMREGGSRTRRPVVAACVGLDGAVWLVIWTAEDRMRFLVLGPQGDSVASVTAPVPFGSIYPAAASSTNLWALVSDQDGVPSIVKYRLTRQDSDRLR